MNYHSKLLMTSHVGIPQTKWQTFEESETWTKIRYHCYPVSSYNEVIVRSK